MEAQFPTPKDAKKSLPIYLELIKENADDAQLQLQLGQCYYILGDYAQSIVHCEKAIDIQPSLAKPHVILAYINYHTGKNVDSIREAETAYQLSPDSAIVLDCYGTILLLLVETRIADAVSFLEAAIKKNPEIYSANASLAFAYLKKGDYIQSLEATKRMFALRPSFKNILKLVSAYQRRYAFLIASVGVLTMIAGIKIKVLLLLMFIFVAQGLWISIQYLMNRNFKSALVYAISYSLFALLLYGLYLL